MRVIGGPSVTTCQVNEGDWWTVGNDMSRGKGVRWQVKF
jgi:hypothetical protein